MSKKHKKTKKVKSKSVAQKTKPNYFKAEPLSLVTKIAISIFFIALAFALYAQCLNYGFVLDDKIVYSGNEYTKKGFAGIWDLLTTDSFKGYFGEQKDLVQGGRYRPLSLVTFAMEHQLWGLRSDRSHFINVLLYGICAMISFSTLRLLFKEKSQGLKVAFSISFLATLLFLVHPIHTEAVANIKGRDEIMAFIFSLLSLRFALQYFDTQKILNLVLMSLAFLLGLFSKENTITFLAVIPFSNLLFRSQNEHASIKELLKGFFVKQNILILTVLLISSVIYLVIRFNVMGYLLNANPSSDIMNNPFYGLGFAEKMATIFYTLFVYLKLSFVPIELTHDYYPYHIPISSFTDAIVILSILLNVMLVVSMFLLLKKRKAISYGIGFYFICLSIVSNIIVDVGTFMNERFIFTASLGLCILLVAVIHWGISFIKKEDKHYWPLLALVPIIGLYSFKTIDRVPVWENELALNRAAIKVSKNSARSNSFMATALFNTYKEKTDKNEKLQLLSEAKPYAEKAVEIHPKYLNGHLMRAGIAAESYRYDNNIDNLLATFKDIMRFRPDVSYLTTYLKYLNDKTYLHPQLIAFYKDIGGNVLLRETKNYSWAAHFLQMGLEISPNDAEIKSYLVEALTAMGRHKDAAYYK